MNRSLMLVPMTALTLLAGCTATTETTPEVVEVAPEPRAIAFRDTTLTADKKTRAGAAMVDGGYTHVLGQRNIGRLVDQGDTPTVTNDLNESMKAFEKAKQSEVTPNKMSASVYEDARWERYCTGGKLTEQDFAFVAERGRHGVPAAMAAECTPPDFTRQQYLAAWQVEQCKTGLDTQQFELIRGRTAAPKPQCTN